MRGARGLPGNPYGNLGNNFQYYNCNSQRHTNYGYYTWDNVRQAEQIETDCVNNEMLLQPENLLAHRLNQGKNTGNYEHLCGSKDLLREVKDNYDDLAKNSYFQPNVQAGWQFKILDMMDQLDVPKGSQILKEDTKKLKKVMMR